MSFKIDAAKTARGTLGFVIQNSANSLLGLVLFAVFARFVTKGEMGVYAGFTLTYTLFQTLGVLGLNIAATRFVAGHSAIMGRWRNGLRTVALVGKG